VGRDSVFGIPTRHGLDGLEIESRLGGGGRFSANRPDWLCGPPSLLYDEYRVSFPGVRRPERGVDHPLLTQRRGKRKSTTIPLFPFWAIAACFRLNHTFYKISKSNCSVSFALHKILQPLNSCKEKYFPLSMSEVSLAVFRIHFFINT